MIIKKFQGKTENEAVEAAKKEMGGNIVIMNVRDLKKKGFFSFFSRGQVEVTVALEEEGEKYTPVKKEENRETVQRRPLPNVQGENSAVLEEKLDNLHALLEQQIQKPEEEKPEEEPETPPSEFERLMKLLYNKLLGPGLRRAYDPPQRHRRYAAHRPGPPGPL